MADELVNLVEYARGMDSSMAVASALIETFAMESDFLQAISFKSVTQGVNRFDREASIPAVGLRGLNEEPEISHGSSETFQDIVSPISGLLEDDRIARKRYGDRKRMTYLKGQMKAASRLWTDLAITGDHKSDPRQWNGLQVRCTADATGSVDGTVDESRLIANSTASGGGALSLAALDVAVNQVNRPTHIMFNRRMKSHFESAARSSTLTNNRVTNDMDTNLGRRVMRFGDCELLFGYEVSRQSQFLPFNEVGYGGGAAQTTSAYVISIREDGICGIQTSAPEYLPVDTDRGVLMRDLFEWDSGITMEDEFSALRLSSITNAPIVA